MKLHIEHAGNGQTIIVSDDGPVAYMAPDLPEGVEEMLAAAFAAAPALLTTLKAEREASLAPLQAEAYRLAARVAELEWCLMNLKPEANGHE